MTDSSFIYRLLTWFSPSYPIGSFHFSHGIEYAVEWNLIKDAKSLEEWISGIIQFGSGRMDLMMFKLSYDLFTAPNVRADPNRIKKLNRLITISNALKLSPELWQESTKQGDAALKALLKSHPSDNLHFLNLQLKKTDKYPVVPIVFGAACADHRIPLKWALTAYLHSFIFNLITAGVKLIPLGQTAGQNIAASLESVIHKCVNASAKSKINDISGASPMVEWTSVKHENQYTRLFQS